MPPCKPVSKLNCEIKYSQTHLRTEIALKNIVNAYVSCHLNPLTWTFHKDAIKKTKQKNKTT